MSPRSWPKAYAPLDAKTLLWQLAVLVVAEIALYASYGAHAAQFHWATHFLVGLTVAALWRAAFLLVAARPTRFQLLSVLGFHLWAMWPDLVFGAPGIPHYHWMDWLALGHISSHYMPGGDSHLAGHRAHRRRRIRTAAAAVASRTARRGRRGDASRADPCHIALRTRATYR